MSKVYVLIPCCNDFMDVVITNDSDSGIRVFKTKEEAEAAIKCDCGLIKSYDGETNTYYSIPNTGLIVLICERNIES